MMENLYPVYYQNRYWEVDECDYLFSSYYISKDCLSSEGSVFIGALGLWVFPDGKTIAVF